MPEQVGSATRSSRRLDQVADHPLHPARDRRLGGAGCSPRSADGDADGSGHGISNYDAKPWNRDTDPRYSFRCALEGWGRPDGARHHGAHNQVHLWIGGHGRSRGHQLGTTTGAASPNDPVFWLIHANVDRLWTAWQSHLRLEVYEPAHGARPATTSRPASQFSELGLGITDEDPARGKAAPDRPARPGDPLEVDYQPPLP